MTLTRADGEAPRTPEIAAQLFISRATVAYQVFTKLDVSSRSQLASVLAAR